MNDSGLSLCYSGSKFMQLSKLLRLSKIHIIGLFFPFLEKKKVIFVLVVVLDINLLQFL